MKRAIQIIVCALVLAGCQKVAAPDVVQYQQAVFHIGGIVGAMPTKVTSTEITNALAAIPRAAPLPL